MDSSICVATMTGFACSRAAWMARLCTSGTCWSGSSTPRSPRATINPSKAATTSSNAATASGFSSLASTGTRRPTSSVTARTNSTSDGRRTSDNATRSTPASSANRRSSTSLGVSAGGDGDAKQVEAFVVADDSALNDTASDLTAIGAEDLKSHHPVVGQDLVPDAHIGRGKE